MSSDSVPHTKQPRGRKEKPRKANKNDDEGICTLLPYTILPITWKHLVNITLSLPVSKNTMQFLLNFHVSEVKFWAVTKQILYFPLLLPIVFVSTVRENASCYHSEFPMARRIDPVYALLTLRAVFFAVDSNGFVTFWSNELQCA